MFKCTEGLKNLIWQLSIFKTDKMVQKWNRKHHWKWVIRQIPWLKFIFLCTPWYFFCKHHPTIITTKMFDTMGQSTKGFESYAMRFLKNRPCSPENMKVMKNHELHTCDLYQAGWHRISLWDASIERDRQLMQPCATFPGPSPSPRCCQGPGSQIPSHLERGPSFSSQFQTVSSCLQPAWNCQTNGLSNICLRSIKPLKMDNKQNVNACTNNFKMKNVIY